MIMVIIKIHIYMSLNNWNRALKMITFPMQIYTVYVVLPKEVDHNYALKCMEFFFSLSSFHRFVMI